jgi:hypothetical protein
LSFGSSSFVAAETDIFAPLPASTASFFALLSLSFATGSIVGAGFGPSR